jgi:hypothetical protein
MARARNVLVAAPLAMLALVAPARHDGGLAAPGGGEAASTTRPLPLPLRIDLMAPPQLRQRTPPAPGWLAYYGEPYTSGRGYGWTEELPSGAGADRGDGAEIRLPDGTTTTPRLLGRPELAHWQGTHGENRPRVFRVDLPDGWYRVACTSVDPGTPLPLVDRRGFKCRAHDAVFAGPAHGRPLATSGVTLVEGTGVVEVTEGHLRIVIGDPAYTGWTWRHPGPWYEGWPDWWGRWGGQRYAERWVQKVTRTVDPGFHSLRLNSLKIETVPPPARPSRVVFRDRFNRDDAPDVNTGVPDDARWIRQDLAGGSAVEVTLSKASLTVTAASRSAVALVQRAPSPGRGRLRYTTRVSLATGEGSAAGRGVHEAGLLLLGDPAAPGDTRSTFVGVTLAGAQGGGLTVRVGNRAGGHQADVTIGPPRLPIDPVAGEYELVVEHDVADRVLSRIAVNGVDATSLVPLDARRQPVDRGVFGIRAVLDPGPASLVLQQSYWAYQVECLPGPAGRPSC